jgi:subtilisin inhibitor-like
MVGGLALGLATASLGAAGQPNLRIVYRADAGASPRVTTLQCNPPGGTVPRPVNACRRLEALGRAAFAPTPRDMACSQIYGGPQTALVTGLLDDARIWARVTRRDGCEIARWNRIAFLLRS